MGMAIFPHSNVQYGSSFIILITLQKLIDTESSVSINDEITYQNNMSEEVFMSSKTSRNN